MTRQLSPELACISLYAGVPGQPTGFVVLIREIAQIEGEATARYYVPEARLIEGHADVVAATVDLLRDRRMLVAYRRKVIVAGPAGETFITPIRRQRVKARIELLAIGNQVVSTESEELRRVGKATLVATMRKVLEVGALSVLPAVAEEVREAFETLSIKAPRTITVDYSEDLDALPESPIVLAAQTAVWIADATPMASQRRQSYVADNDYLPLGRN